jgi:hypothetical protein
LRGLGRPICIGVSRKSFVGEIAGEADPASACPARWPPRRRGAGGADLIPALTTLETVQAVRVARPYATPQGRLSMWRRCKPSGAGCDRYRPGRARPLSCLRHVQETRAVQMLLWLAPSWPPRSRPRFGFYGTGWILDNFWSFWVLALIVLFQPELRRALAQVGQNRSSAW